MVAICLKHVLEYSGILGSDQKNLAFKEQNPKLLDLGKILELLIITLSLVIAVIPEGLQLSVIYCLSQYASIGLFKDGKLIFKKLKTLENMGRLDVLVLEKSGTLTKINECTVKKWWIPGNGDASDVIVGDK